MSRSALEKQMRMEMQRAQQQQFELRQQQLQRQQQQQMQQLQQQQAMAYAAAYQQQAGAMYDPYTLAMYQQQVAAAGGYYDPYAAYAASVAAAPAATNAIPAVAPVGGYEQGAAVPAAGDEEDEDFDSDPAKKKNTVPMHGSANYNINTLLFDNIMSSDYFRALFQLRTYHEVISEIERVVKHVEPWQTGTSRFPSSAFCLLVKFMTMKLTYKQLNGLLCYTDCVYVRALGLLYLRYVCPPADLWKWVAPYLEDDQPISPVSDANVKMTMGTYVVKLLTEMQYYGTTLPRIPVLIERKFKVYLLLLEEKKKQRAQNLRVLDRFVVGTSVEAMYSDDANEPAWYAATIDSVVGEEEAEGDREDNSKPRKIGPRSVNGVKRHRFWVTFPEYGNSECVDLGDMRLPTTGSSVEKEKPQDATTTVAANEVSVDENDATSLSNDVPSLKESIGRREREDHRDISHSRERDRSRSRDRDLGREKHPYRRERREDSRDRDRDRHHYSRRSRSRSRSPVQMSKRESTEDLLQKVLEAERNASAAVGKNYARRPASYKGSLSMKLDTYNARKRSPPRGGGTGGGSGGGRSRRSRTPSPPPTSYNQSSQQQPVDRMKMLKEKYGDASALNK